MRLGNVFDNGKAQTRAAICAAVGFVHPVKPLKQPGKMFSGKVGLIHDF